MKLSFNEILHLRYVRQIAKGYILRDAPFRADYYNRVEEAQRFIWTWLDEMPIDRLINWYNMIIYPHAKLRRQGDHAILEANDYYHNEATIKLEPRP